MELLIEFGKIAVVLLLVFLNGFFVAAEFAIVKVRSTQIEPLADRGIKRAQIAHHLIGHLDTYLSACQLGITLTSLGLGWVGEPFVARLIEPALEILGITQPALISTIGFAVAFGIITFLHIVLGELAPKSLAIQKSQATTLAIARPLHLFFVIFKPVIDGLNSTANFFLRIGGLGTVSESELAHSEEELRILLSRGKTISTTGKSILLRAMELRERTVREVMVPRTEIVFVSTDKSLDENIATTLENQFTRYPLCEGDLDHIIGMVHLKDLFRLSRTGNTEMNLSKIVRETPFVPETMPLEQILSVFLSRRVLMAIAIDEYGGTAGLVTLEDVLEELVGEIRDEFDVEPAMIQKVRDDEYLVEGTMPLHDFSRVFEFKPESKEVVTVSGYVIHTLGHVPERGASFRLGDWVGTVDAMEGSKVRLLRVRKGAGTPPDGEAK